MTATDRSHHTSQIHARKVCNRTGIRVSAGCQYHVTATGSWRDWNIATDARGYPIAQARWYSRPLLRALDGRKRLRSANWFALVLTIEADESTAVAPFSSGGDPSVGVRWVAPRDGELCAFANDHRWAYGNNSGSIQLSLERIANAEATDRSA